MKKYGAEKRKKTFFKKHANYVARHILGDFLVIREKNNILVGRIVETESYPGLGDDASHGSSGKKTTRSEILYREGGLIYVYLIYGLYWCFNIVTSRESNPQSVLIRALEPLAGIDLMVKRRKGKIKNLTKGPCCWTMAFGINKNFLGKDITSNQIFVLKKKKKNFIVGESTRVGIDYAACSKDRLLRYYIKENQYVSQK